MCEVLASLDIFKDCESNINHLANNIFRIAAEGVGELDASILLVCQVLFMLGRGESLDITILLTPIFLFREALAFKIRNNKN